MTVSVGGRHAGLLKDKTRVRSSRMLLPVLLNYLRDKKRELILISVFVLIFTITSTISPIVIQNIIDNLNLGTSNQYIFLIICIFFILSILMWLFDSLTTWFLAIIQADLIHHIRIDAFNSLVGVDMNYHHSQQSGNITSRIINDVEEIATGINVFTTTSTQILLLVVTFIVLFIINWIFALISLLSVPVALAIIWIMSNIGKERMIRVRRAYGEISGRLAEALSGITISKSFNREEETSKQIRLYNDESYKYQKQLGFVFMLVMPSISMVSTMLVAIILIVGGYLKISAGLTIGVIYLGSIMVQRFLSPLINLGNYFTQLQASLAALDRIVDVLEIKAAVLDDPFAKNLNTSNTSIKFCDVNFSYKLDTPVLKNISFTIPMGHKVALIGHTGAGKSTITSLLLRFYDPNSGVISIGDQDIKKITLQSLHKAISLVPQEPYLFSGTVLENIRYGRTSATDDEIKSLCNLIGADQFIEALPNGYNSVLQESGKSLSAGQRQMITIARTMLTDPKILVLDEATSRLDAYSESLVQIAQNMLFKGRTTLVIAHRLSTIKDVDSIIVIDAGKIIETGTHQELLSKRGVYYELYKTYYMHQGARSIDEIIEEKAIQQSMQV
ncbi:MAG: ABC transporter ATP-binding protein [Candidatus Thorarchaeota archaeon]